MQLSIGETRDTFDLWMSAIDKPTPKLQSGKVGLWRTADPVMSDTGEIEVGGMWEPQRVWWNLPNYIRCFVGGYGCVSAETLILDPTTGNEKTTQELSEIGKSIRVLSLMQDGQTKVRWATAPFVKGVADLWRVTLSDGKTVTVTKQHKFLTRSGWLPLSCLSNGAQIRTASRDSHTSRWRGIVKLENLGPGTFYDLTVPGPANYLAQGIWHHNSGKSFSACKRTISLALENAPWPVAIVSPAFPLARKTTIPTLQGLLAGKERALGPKFKWRYNSTTHELKINYRGRDALIYVLSGENSLSLRGPNLAAATLDEAFMMPVEVFNQMVARVRAPSAKKLEINIVGTPEMGWGYDLCEGELKEKFDVGTVHAPTYSNKALSEIYLSRLQSSLDDRAQQAYVEGNFINLSTGLIFYGYKKHIHRVSLPMPEDCELGCGMDFNVNPMTAAVFWRQGNHMHFFKEYELPNADTEYLCQVLRDRFGGKLQNIYPDATGGNRRSAGGRSDFWYIRNAGFNICAPSSNPNLRDRYNAVNGKFHVRPGSNPTLTIDINCKKLDSHLNQLSHENLHKQRQLEHLCACFSYPVAYLYPVTKDVMEVINTAGV